MKKGKAGSGYEEWMPEHDGAVLTGLVREGLSEAPEWGAISKSRAVVVPSLAGQENHLGEL